MALNNRQQLFLNGLLEGKTRVSAYTAAGYSSNPKTAEVNACKLFAKPDFAKEYQAAMERVADRAEASVSRVLREECRLAYADIRQLFNGETVIPPDQLPEDVARALAGVEIIERFIPRKRGKPVREVRYKYKFIDKGAALQRISKHLGMYEKDNQQKAEPAFLLAILAALPEEYALLVKKRLREIAQEGRS